MVLRILKMCIMDFFLLCFSSGQSEFMDSFVVFNLWIGPGFIFESFSQFLIFQLPFSCYYPCIRLIKYGGVKLTKN